MLSSKYVKDYRMDTETTSTGKVKRKMVYVGPFYTWDLEGKVFAGLRRRYTLSVLAGWVCFLGSMLFYSKLSRLWYVILPYTFLILVLFFATCAVWNLYFAGQPMTRECKEKTWDRMRSSSVMGMLCCVVTAVGLVTGMLQNRCTQMEDFLFSLGDVFIFLFLLYGFKASKRLNVKETENPVAAEWKDK